MPSPGQSKLAALRHLAAAPPADHDRFWPEHRPRLRRVLGVIAVVTMIGITVVLLLHSGGGAPAEGIVPAREDTTMPDAVGDEVGSSSTIPGCDPVSTPLKADVNRDGCPEAISYSDGILRAGDVRFALGLPGDTLLTGAWREPGAITPAIFRPSNGAIFRFDEWATSGIDMTVTASAVVPGGTDATVSDIDGDGRDEVLVARRSGGPVVVQLTGGGTQPRSPTSVPRE